ncbi:MAG: LPS assembly lipoprotein LptE [Schleiferiaceae bacterium]|nr:LPS assembly lipoprotein LptE [Schleiferiaceae bacterium]
MRKLLAICTVLSLAIACSGGYSFTGGDIGDAKTFGVKNFPNYADLVNPNLSQEVTEGLRQIFLNQTRLKLVDLQPDMEFEGSITGYTIVPISAQANETSAQNKLTVTVNVIFTNHLDAEKSYDQTFSRFRDFNADVPFSDVEETLVREIVEELCEDILNKAIVNW